MATRYLLFALIAALLLVLVWMSPRGLALLASTGVLLVAAAMLKLCRAAAR